MKAITVSNGSIRDYSYCRKYFLNADCVFCTDGAAAHLRKFEIRPDILLGDFDSISDSDYQYYVGMGVEIAKFSKEKDMSDTELAVHMAIERGCTSLVIIGGMGTRADHSLSNVFLLRKILEAGASGILADEKNEITIINDKICIKKEDNIKVSLLPLTERVTGVTTKGLYYPLVEAVIEMGSTWGVSNEFTEDTAEVTIKGGLMMVIKSRD